MRIDGWKHSPADPNHAEVDAITDAVVDALQPFARAGASGWSAISACVSVLCKMAEETDEGKYIALTEVMELLNEQAEEWRHRDGLPEFEHPGVSH